jgi:DegV family protein with EDD domain
VYYNRISSFTIPWEFTMTIRIVTDSTSDLPQTEIDRYGIEVIHNYINMQDESRLDGIEITRQEFYQRMPNCYPPPTTSGPGPEFFVRTYRRLAEAGASAIVSIHVASEWRHIIDTATVAARETTVVPVTVIDSRQLSLGLGSQVIAAAQAAQAGCPVKEIRDMVEDMITRVYIFAVLDTLEYLRRSGRVSRLMSGLGNLLQIKPVITVHSGRVKIDRERTFKNGSRRLIDLAERIAPLEHLSLVHAHAPERLASLRPLVAHLLPSGKPSYTEEVTPAIGVHVGPGAVGVVCVAARPG